jgi:hypothetical protein
MTAQNSDQSAEPQRGNQSWDKFPEPRAWAMEWDMGTPGQMSSRDSGYIPALQEPKQSNGKWEKFPQPRGWSLEWDGPSMAEFPEFSDRRSALPPR